MRLHSDLPPPRRSHLSMTTKLDKSGRRPRDTATPSGRVVRREPRDLQWAEFGHRHGPLPWPYFHEYTSKEYVNQNRARDRFTSLFHDDAFFGRPKAQRRTDRSQFNVLVYEPAEKALRELEYAGLYRKYAPGASPNHWFHDFELSCFTASIHLATLGTEYTYIFQDEILERAGRPLEFDVGHIVDGKNIYYRPDRMFGIGYPDGTKRIFVVERDRGTEVERTAFGRKSIERLAQHAKRFIADGRYRELLNIPGGVVLINITTTRRRMDNMMRMWEEVTGPCNYAWFAVMPRFEDVLKPPGIMKHYLTDPYERPGRPPIRIVGE